MQAQRTIKVLLGKHSDRKVWLKSIQDGDVVEIEEIFRPSGKVKKRTIRVHRPINEPNGQQKGKSMNLVQIISILLALLSLLVELLQLNAQSGSVRPNEFELFEVPFEKTAKQPSSVACSAGFEINPASLEVPHLYQNGNTKVLVSYLHAKVTPVAWCDRQDRIEDQPINCFID